MAVATRLFRSAEIGGHECLAAVRNSRGIVAGFAFGTKPLDLRDSDLETPELHQIGRNILAHLPQNHPVDADKPEVDLLAGKKVLVAIRNGETADAALDWLAYHAAAIDAHAALIVDRDPPGGSFADDLAVLDPDLPVIVVAADSPLGMPDAPDARHPALAPGSKTRELPPNDPWHAPFAAPVIHELLRHRFLAKAKALAFLNVGDLVLPNPGSSPFTQALAAPGRALLMQGVEIYPWRLRQGNPAPHSDHVAVRRNERRMLASWCIAPAAIPEDEIWFPARLKGLPVDEAKSIQFRRAMGVVFPGVEVNHLVRKPDLTEDPTLVEMMASAFDRPSIRLPRSALIPPRPATQNVTVVTAMKNEGPFILDWIAHNRASGIDRHLVYTNDCADGTDRLLDLLAGAGVTRRNNPFRETGKVPQHAAFRAAEHEETVTSADWLLTIDVDEYINIHVGEGRIGDLLSAAPDAHVISMPWRLFGNADRHWFEDRPVTEIFTRAAPQYAPRPYHAWAFKSLYRNADLFRRLGVHRPKGTRVEFQGQINWIDANGRPLPISTLRSAWRMSKANWGYDLVSLNHYAVRSAESFLVKRDRGRVNHTTREQGEAYWFRMNQNAEEDVSIRRFDARVNDEKATLLALPGVAEAHDSAVTWHSTRAATLRFSPEHAGFYQTITSSRMEKLSRMATFFGSNVYHQGPHVIPEDVVDRDPEIQFYFTVDPITE